MRTAQERFARLFRVDEASGCWVWTGSLTEKGYPQFRNEVGRTVRAHRWSYEHFVAPISPDLVVDHVCRNRACVRPDPKHLEPITQAENLQRKVKTPPPPHGRGRYAHYGCRCDVCREAESTYKRAWRQSRSAA